MKTHLCPHSQVELGRLVEGLHADGLRLNLRYNRFKATPILVSSSFSLITSLKRKAKLFFLRLVLVVVHFSLSYSCPCLEISYMH